MGGGRRGGGGRRIARSQEARQGRVRGESLLEVVECKSRKQEQWRRVAGL